MANLSGKFTLVSSENFEEYMKALGIPEPLRKAGMDPNAGTEIIQNGDVYEISLSAGGHTVNVPKFTLDKEFDDKTPHGLPVKTIVRREGNKLIQTQTGDVSTTITRELNGDELIVTVVAGDVTSIRKYKRV